MVAVSQLNHALTEYDYNIFFIEHYEPGICTFMLTSILEWYEEYVWCVYFCVGSPVSCLICW